MAGCNTSSLQRMEGGVGGVGGIAGGEAVLFKKKKNVCMCVCWKCHYSMCLIDVVVCGGGGGAYGGGRVGAQEARGCCWIQGRPGLGWID